MTGATTLLLVDVQEDFLARPGLTPDRATFLSSIAALIAHARGVGWNIVHVHSRVAADGSDAMPHRRGAMRAEVVAGSAGAEAPSEAAPAPGETVLFKRFFSAFDAGELEDLLRERGTRRLVVAGTHVHACIRDTVDDAYRRGYEVIVAADAVATYDAPHAAMALAWMGERAARVVALAELTGSAAPAAAWQHLDACDQRRVLGNVRLTPADEVRRAAETLSERQLELDRLGIERRRELLERWLDLLAASRDELRAALVRDVAKPLRDADGEIAYGLGLVEAAIAGLADAEAQEAGRVYYRPRGLVGLITPWNNPFAIAVGKIAPALGYGNAVLWKPALPGTGIARIVAGLLDEASLGECVSVVPGASATGEALVAAPELAALSFTGSVPVGRHLIARASVRPSPVPVQAELGGSNAAIVDSSAELDAAAADLAAAMFSFSGQRCTAVRRIIVLEEIADSFVERLVHSVRALTIGMPDDPAYDIGPLIDRASQQRILAAAEEARTEGAKLLCGGRAPDDMPAEGCWVEPTLIDGLPADHRLNCEELFGPIGTILRVRDFDRALTAHNRSPFGLLGALYSHDEAHAARFAREAQAGILSVGRARPPFAASAPFTGWKASGHGPPEHGRWNRDFYTRTQAVYVR